MHEAFADTLCGRIKGQSRDGVRIFHGIPYCEPPLGKLRFMPPVAKAPWSGTLDCTGPKPIAPQGPSGLAAPMGPIAREQSEDCLTLAVWAPENASGLPVAAWLHGGAFYSGAGSLDWYSGEKLARTGKIIVAGVNYRLGPLGFLRYPGACGGNQAILDQAMALRWVHDNISRFGGDPQRVTVFGHSAGANSIVQILSMPETRDLFQQAGLMSPSLGRGSLREADAEEIGRVFVETLGCTAAGSAGVMEHLQAAPVAEILRAFAAAAPKLAPRFGRMFFSPVNDAWHDPAAAISAAAGEAASRRLRLVIGTVKDEMLAFSTDRTREGLARLKNMQRSRFDGPALHFAEAASNAGCQVRVYRFDWSAPGSVYGACHSVDMPFIFGNLEAWDAPMLAGASVQGMEPLSRSCMEAFTKFVRGGDFAGGEWPLFSRERPVRRIFGGSGCSLSEANA